MAKFITGTDLENAICDIICEAKEKLLIVSPFIKLDGYFIDQFNRLISKPHLHLIIVFGKNEQDKSKSLNKSDFEFFKQFPNVSIIYEANLHAKYYGNETKGVITSVNLYDHSFKNNIEFGVYSEVSIMDKFTTSADQDAWKKCVEIAEAGEAVFIKRPVFKKKMLQILGKDYVSSKVLLDNTESFFTYGNRQHSKEKLADFADELDFGDKTEDRLTREQFNAQHPKEPVIPAPVEAPVKQKQYVVYQKATGYCIRTGVEIPFNPERPYSADAYKSWAQYGNPDYKEKYCHKTGQYSNGKTSMRNPVMQ